MTNSGVASPNRTGSLLGVQQIWVALLESCNQVVSHKSRLGEVEFRVPVKRARGGCHFCREGESPRQYGNVPQTKHILHTHTQKYKHSTSSPLQTTADMHKCAQMLTHARAHSHIHGHTRTHTNKLHRTSHYAYTSADIHACTHAAGSMDYDSRNLSQNSWYSPRARFTSPVCSATMTMASPNVYTLCI